MLGHSDQHWNVSLGPLPNQVDQTLTLGFQFSEAIDHKKIGSFMDRGINQLRNAGQLCAVERTSHCTQVGIVGDGNDFATRKHDCAYLAVVEMTHPAVKLYEPCSADAQAAKIFGEVEQQTVGIVFHPNTTAAKSHWASNIQPSAVSLYFGIYIESRQSCNARLLRPAIHEALISGANLAPDPLRNQDGAEDDLALNISIICPICSKHAGDTMNISDAIPTSSSRNG
jgi:hypothetical protein